MAKKNKEYCTIGLGGGHREYNINGVKYIVSGEFSKPDDGNKGITLYDRMESYIGSEFSDIVAMSADTSVAANVA